MKRDVGEQLKSGSSYLPGGQSSWMRSALVATQVAMTSVLLLSTGLLIRSTYKIISNPLGFQPAGLLTEHFRIDEKRHSSVEQKALLGATILERIAKLPGVDSASVSGALPFADTRTGVRWCSKDSPPPPGARPSVPIIAISPAYFRTLQVPLLAGREFNGLDRAGSPRVAIVNQSFARHFYGTRDPIGTRLRWGADGFPWETVVGIAADVRHRGQDLDPQPELFVPFAQTPGDYLVLAVRTTVPPQAMAAAVRRQLAQTDREIPLFGVQTMSERIAAASEKRRLELWTVVGFAGLALLVSLSGLYGVMSYIVSRRSREFGLRIALGSSPSAVAVGVVTQGLLVALTRLGPGVTAAWFANQVFVPNSVSCQSSRPANSVRSLRGLVRGLGAGQLSPCPQGVAH